MTRPLLAVCMGVAGCGKSTLAHGLVQGLARGVAPDREWVMVEADDFHSVENRQLMASGRGLTAVERAPWMSRVCGELARLKAQGSNVALAHSALRRSARDQLRALGFETVFFHLAGSQALIRQRLAARSRHFVGADLLPSQLRDLQPPDGESDVVPLDLQKTPEELLAQAVRWMGAKETT